MRIEHLFIAAIIIMLGTAGFWLASHLATTDSQETTEQIVYEEGYDPNVSGNDPRIEKLEQLALESCRCRGTGGTNCDQEFEKIASQFERSEMATACEPISTSWTCIATDQGEKCVVTGYGIDGICTSDEARAVESAWRVAYNKAEGDGETIPSKVADASMQKTIDRLLAGEEVAAVETEAGCAG